MRFLICTDVAARGIDIRELPFVLNLTLPEKAETYIHRSGRVGRADRPGLSISIVSTVKERVWWHSNSCKFGKARGRGCTDTRLVDHKVNSGGCTTWYDEPQILDSIRTRLTGHLPVTCVSIERLADEMHRVARVSAEAREGRDSLLSGQSGKHVRLLQPVVKHLAALEADSQRSFITSCHSHKWNAMLRGKPATGINTSSSGPGQSSSTENYTKVGKATSGLQQQSGKDAGSAGKPASLEAQPRNAAASLPVSAANTADAFSQVPTILISIDQSAQLAQGGHANIGQSSSSLSSSAQGGSNIQKQSGKDAGSAAKPAFSGGRGRGGGQGNSQPSRGKGGHGTWVAQS